MSQKQVNPVHLFKEYADYQAAIESVKGDLIPLGPAWLSVKEVFHDFDAFCEFVNANGIENWFYSDDVQQSMRFRYSQFRRAITEFGLVKDEDFRIP